MIRRVFYPQQRFVYEAAWHWMHRRPDLYRGNVGFFNLAEFASGGELSVIDFALEDDAGALVGFASLILRGPGACQFCLILPPAPRLRVVMRGLRALERQYFCALRYWYLFVSLPDGAAYAPARRFALAFGFRPQSQNAAGAVLEKTVLDFLRETCREHQSL